MAPYSAVKESLRLSLSLTWFFTDSRGKILKSWIGYTTRILKSQSSFQRTLQNLSRAPFLSLPLMLLSLRLWLLIFWGMDPFQNLIKIGETGILPPQILSYVHKMYNFDYNFTGLIETSLLWVYLHSSKRYV